MLTGWPREKHISIFGTGKIFFSSLKRPEGSDLTHSAIQLVGGGRGRGVKSNKSPNTEVYLYLHYPNMRTWRAQKQLYLPLLTTCFKRVSPLYGSSNSAPHVLTSNNNNNIFRLRRSFCSQNKQELFASKPLIFVLRWTFCEVTIDVQNNVYRSFTFQRIKTSRMRFPNKLPHWVVRG
jgi:hypothetical protein